MREGLTGIPADGEEAFRVTLFRQLAEEDPKRALVLLDPLPAENRSRALFDSTWLSHRNVAPDHFLRFLASVPDATSPSPRRRPPPIRKNSRMTSPAWRTCIRGWRR